MPHLRRCRVAQTGFAVLLLICLAWFGASPAQAQTADAYTVRNVAVDISATNVAVARDEALIEGQRQALQTVLQRLTAPADWARLPKLNDKDMQDLVLDVGIDQEKRSSVRYLATLSVRFKPEALRRLLRGAGIAYAEWRGRPVAVLPVLQPADPTAPPILWETPNPWRDAWKSGAAQGIVPLVVPPAPPVDPTPDPLLTSASVATASPEVIASLSAHYNTQDIVIVTAKAQPVEGGASKFDLSLTGSGPVGAGLSGARSYVANPGETQDALLRRIVEDIAKAANESYKSSNLLQFDHAATLSVLVPLNGSLTEWAAVRDKLNRSTPVRSFEIGAISKSEASLVLHYVGDQSQLAQVFMQNGLVLSWAEDHWILQNATAGGR